MAPLRAQLAILAALAAALAAAAGGAASPASERGPTPGPAAGERPLVATPLLTVEPIAACPPPALLACRPGVRIASPLAPPAAAGEPVRTTALGLVIELRHR